MKALSIVMMVATALISPLAAQDDLEGLKKRVDELEKRAAANAPKDGYFAKLGSAVHFYGFLRLDVAYDDSEVNDPQLPQYVISEDATAGQDGSDDSSLTMYTKLTRLGFDFDGSDIERLGGKVSGKMEMDFYGDTSDSRNQLRMRHSYLKLDVCDTSILAGQTSDLISPIAPVVNSDMVMWNAGNLGDRRPQLRVDYHPISECCGAQTFVQTLVGLPGAVAGENVNGDGITDGEDSGKPVYQARLARKQPFLFEKQSIEVGIWMHRSWEEADTNVGGSDDEFNSRATGIDLQVPLYENLLWAKGEAWKGANLDDIRGGIGQGVNTTTGATIKARGYWVELGYQVCETTKVFVGSTTDNPEDSDLSSGLPLTLSNRKRNEIRYVAVECSGYNPVTLGLELLDWTTEYRGLDDGDDTRVKFYIAYKF